MHDARARLLLEEALRQEPDQVVPLDELPRLIEEEAAVVVPIPGETHIRAGATHHIGGGGAVIPPRRDQGSLRAGRLLVVVLLRRTGHQKPCPRNAQQPPPTPAPD